MRHTTRPLLVLGLDSLSASFPLLRGRRLHLVFVRARTGRLFLGGIVLLHLGCFVCRKSALVLEGDYQSLHHQTLRARTFLALHRHLTSLATITALDAELLLDILKRELRVAADVAVVDASFAGNLLPLFGLCALVKNRKRVSPNGVEIGS